MIQFTNIKKSAIQLSLDYKYGAGKVLAANLLPGVNVQGGRVQKGQRVFDWENALRFSLFPTEAAEIYTALVKSQLPQDGINIQHSPKADFRQSVSSLWITSSQPYLNITVSKREGDNNQTCSYGMKGGEIRLFILWLDEVSKIPLKQDLVSYIMYTMKERGIDQKNQHQSSFQNNVPENVTTDPTSGIATGINFL